MAEINNNDGGSIVSRAGDINGNGIDDIIIAGSTVSYILFGSKEEWTPSVALNTLNGTSGFLIMGNAYSVNAADDINGDGIDDFLVSDITANNFTGKTSVVFGHKGPWPGLIDLDGDYLDGKRGFTINGINPNDKSGYSISGAGDINGDGIKDFLIGAPGANNGVGQAYAIFGSKEALPAVFNLSQLNGKNGFVLNGIEGRLDGIGASISWAGDVNNDGFKDFLIGTASSEYTTGESYLVFGSNAKQFASIDLGNLDGKNGCIIHAAGHSSSLSGTGVTGVGDFNGDKIADILIGAWGIDETAGLAYLIYGHNQTWPAQMNLNDLDGKNGFPIHGVNITGSSFSSVDGLGDINNDGLADLLISAYAANDYEGQTFVVFGTDKNPESIELSNIDGTNGFTINSDNIYGIASNGAGDFNGDGIQDIVIGTLLDSFNKVEQSYVVFGCCNDNDDSLTIGLGIAFGTIGLAAIGITSAYYGYQHYHHGYETIADSGIN